MLKHSLDQTLRQHDDIINQNRPFPLSRLTKYIEFGIQHFGISSMTKFWEQWVVDNPSFSTLLLLSRDWDSNPNINFMISQIFRSRKGSLSAFLESLDFLSSHRAEFHLNGSGEAGSLGRGRCVVLGLTVQLIDHLKSCDFELDSSESQRRAILQLACLWLRVKLVNLKKEENRDNVLIIEVFWKLVDQISASNVIDSQTISSFCDCFEIGTSQTQTEGVLDEVVSNQDLSVLFDVELKVSSSLTIIKLSLFLLFLFYPFVINRFLV